jgi:predicted transcriptional regulator
MCDETKAVVVNNDGHFLQQRGSRVVFVEEYPEADLLDEEQAVELARKHQGKAIKNYGYVDNHGNEFVLADHTDEEPDYERQGVEKVVQVLLAAGYSLSVDDGGDELTLINSTDEAAIMDALMNTAEDTLIARKEGARAGEVTFVYGNAPWEVVADHSGYLNDVLKPATEWLSQLEDQLGEEYYGV